MSKKSSNQGSDDKWGLMKNLNTVLQNPGTPREHTDVYLNVFIDVHQLLKKIQYADNQSNLVIMSNHKYLHLWTVNQGVVGSSPS